MRKERPLTIVIKLGTSSIVDEQTYEPQFPIVSTIVDTAIKLRRDGHRVVIVSSGAIGVGMRRMGLDKKPKSLAKIQALASIGQLHLMHLFEGIFVNYRQPVAQILLTRNDIADETQYRNAKQTFNELFSMGVIPIVNENDTLSVSEIKFGDNDTLSAITAAMVQADYLFLMTDVDCLYDKNPRTHPDAKPIEVVEDISTLEADVSTPGSTLGTGGMSTKIVAARLATSAGVTTVITRSSLPKNIRSIVHYLQSLKTSSTTSSSRTNTPPATISPAPKSDDPLSLASLSTTDPSPPSTTTAPPPLHTRFLPDPHPIRDKYFWILYGLAPHGTLYIDEGAAKALLDRGAGLLPVGVVAVEGPFAQQESVRLVVVRRLEVDKWERVEGQPELGRALVNYSSSEIARIRGVQSSEIEGILGYAESDYVAPRGNISIFKRGGSRPVTPSRVPSPRQALSPRGMEVQMMGVGVFANQ